MSSDAKIGHSNADETSLRALHGPLLPLAKRFYQEQHYRCRFDRSSDVFGLMLQTQLVACTHIDKSEEFYFLRAMVVAQTQRGKGFGTVLLQQVMLNYTRKDCWCLPFVHLESFYHKAGFRVCSDELCHKDVRDKLERYRKQGKRLIAMRKVAAATAGN